jgi:glycosyltransferase involved in cell wall biosynthesis
LLLGSGLRDADLGLVMPALQRLKQEYGEWVVIECLGLPRSDGVPPWIRMPVLPLAATVSYPGFVHWITRQPGWDIGLVPLAVDPASRDRSGSQVLECAALGMAVLASDVSACRSGLADGSGGMLVGADPHDWYASINWLIRNPGLRRALAAGALEGFRATGTLAAQAAARREAWEGLVRLSPSPCGNGSLRGPSPQGEGESRAAAATPAALQRGRGKKLLR